MARLYSGKHGKSRSKKPPTKTVPVWVEYDAKQVEELVVKYAKEGYSSAMIGQILRDQYGIPDVRAITGKKIMQIIKEHNLQPKLPEDLLALIKKIVKIKEHMKQHKKDMTAKRGYILTLSKIRRLVKYYKKKGVLPEDWYYTEEVDLLVK